MLGPLKSLRAHRHCMARFLSLGRLHPDENADRAARLLGLGWPWRVEHVLAVGYPLEPPRGDAAIGRGRLPMQELVWEV